MSETVIYGMSIVLLICVCGLGLWFLRQSLGLEGVALFTPKQRRLGVVESTSIDGRRRLLLVRRDNVEHLIMTGGPVDVLVETGIPVAPRPTILGLEPLPAHAPVLNGHGAVHDPVLPRTEKAPVPTATETN
jgi:flagellar protein FliO/FliZ